jgi:hypothetical protein
MNVMDTLKGSRTGVEPDMSIEAGNRVRSYDFAGSDTCYAEGVVEEITEPMEGCRRYKIRVESRVFDGASQPSHEEYVYPPLNGTPSTFGGVTNAVARIN